jgi:hypothetical protein
MPIPDQPLEPDPEALMELQSFAEELRRAGRSART